MEKNVSKKQEVRAMAVVNAQAVQYVDKVDADRENRIVGEIRMITEQTKQVVLMASIEIGRRLTEAKSLVRHGQWSAWLKDRIDYSQRTANNFMRIYREYGETGMAEKSQSIANLSYTHALALLDVPAEERAKFAEERNAKDMKIKELQEEIKAMNEQRNRDGEKYGKLIAEKDALAEKAKAAQRELEEQVKKLEQQAGEAQQAEVKKQLELAVAKERAELEKAGERVRGLQSEIAQLAEEQRKEIERVRKQEQVAAQGEIAKRDKLIAQTREEMKAELEKAKTELEKSRKEVKEEQEKNRLAENLAICAFAIDELLDRYAQVIDTLLSIQTLDGEKAKKLMADLEKSLAMIRQKANLKIAVA